MGFSIAMMGAAGSLSGRRRQVAINVQEAAFHQQVHLGDLAAGIKAPARLGVQRLAGEGCFFQDHLRAFGLEGGCQFHRARVGLLGGQGALQPGEKLADRGDLQARAAVHGRLRLALQAKVRCQGDERRAQVALKGCGAALQQGFRRLQGDVQGHLLFVHHHGALQIEAAREPGQARLKLGAADGDRLPGHLIQV